MSKVTHGQHSYYSSWLQEMDRRPLGADPSLEAMLNNRRYIMGNNSQSCWPFVFVLIICFKLEQFHFRKKKLRKIISRLLLYAKLYRRLTVKKKYAHFDRNESFYCSIGIYQCFINIVLFLIVQCILWFYYVFMYI